jgi:tetratricopeptide (TPR) repeat protein
VSENPVPSQSALENIHARSIRVGDITQTINYYQTTQALSTTVNNWLPPVPGVWQERKEEQTISNYLADNQTRLVGIYSAGGFGKSALAAQVFREAEGFSHKLWANFQEPTDFGTFGRWLIQELLGKEVYAKVRDLYERDTDDELIVKTLNELGQRRCLVVLDHLETLFQTEELWQPYGEFLAGWLGLASAGTLLLTSQLRLDLPGSAWQWLPLKGLELAQGVALLKAQQIEGSDEQLAEFVDRVDGHPLLLRLAASWLQQQAANELEPATIDRLGSEILEILGQHRGDTATSVGKLLDMSFSRLHPEWLQVLLWRLSVLRGSFGLEMAQAMVSEAVDLSQMRQLARWSFVQEQKVAKEWWFEFLPLIGRYLQLGAKRSGEEISGHQRAIKYFSEHIQEWDGTTASCAEELEIFHHQCEQGEYQLAYRVINGCENQLNLAGYYQELIKVYDRLTREWQPTNDDERRNLGWAWTRLGNLDRSIGQVQVAITAHESAQQLFERIDLAEGKAASLGNLGNAYHSLGQYQRAIDFLQQTLNIAREIGDRHSEAASLGNLGNAYHSLGQYQRAIDFHQQSLVIKREIGDRYGEASSLGGLGNAYQSLGQYQQAIDFHQQHLNIAGAIGDRYGEASSLGNLGIAYHSLGEYQRAIDFQQQHLNIAWEIGDRHGESNSLCNLGNAYHSLGQYQQAIDFHQQSLVIKREIGDRYGEASSLGGLGNAYDSLGEYQRAIDFLQQTLNIARAIGDRHGIAKALFNQALALAKYETRRFEAIENLQQARTIYLDLELNHMVEQCDDAIHDFNQIIATESPFRAPTIRPLPPAKPDWWEKSLPSQEKKAPTTTNQQWWLWFAAGLAIALIIWRLKN